MTNHDQSDNRNEDRRDAGISDLFGSMVGFATASTKFTLQQMQNAMTVFTDPQTVMNRVKDSMDHISHAMSQPVKETGAKGRSSADPQPADDSINGRKS